MILLTVIPLSGKQLAKQKVLLCNVIILLIYPIVNVISLACPQSDPTERHLLYCQFGSVFNYSQ
jgi:hypothetical protein